MNNHRRLSVRALVCVAMLAGTLALAATADAQTSGGSGGMGNGMGNMPGMSGMAAVQSSIRGSFFDLLRAAIATAPFHSLDVAQNFGGYTVEVQDLNHITCIAQPPDGAMGVHFLNPSLIDLSNDPNVTDTIDASKPEALVYEPDGAGHFRLVALEYLILQDEWNANHNRPPSLFGQTFMATDGNNRFGLPPYYSLHAWIWKFNPSGTFTMWNPNVHCPVS
jgi:hypothetical protein